MTDEINQEVLKTLLEKGVEKQKDKKNGKFYDKIKEVANAKIEVNNETSDNCAKAMKSYIELISLMPDLLVNSNSEQSDQIKLLLRELLEEATPPHLKNISGDHLRNMIKERIISDISRNITANFGAREVTFGLDSKYLDFLPDLIENWKIQKINHNILLDNDNPEIIAEWIKYKDQPFALISRYPNRFRAIKINDETKAASFDITFKW